MEDDLGQKEERRTQEVRDAARSWLTRGGWIVNSVGKVVFLQDRECCGHVLRGRGSGGEIESTAMCLTLNKREEQFMRKLVF